MIGYIEGELSILMLQCFELKYIYLKMTGT